MAYDPDLGFDPATSAVDDTPEQAAARLRAIMGPLEAERSYARSRGYNVEKQTRVWSPEELAATQAAVERDQAAEQARRTNPMSILPPHLQKHASELSPIQIDEVAQRMGWARESYMVVEGQQREWERRNGRR